jgi:hypothetical protein
MKMGKQRFNVSMKLEEERWYETRKGKRKGGKERERRRKIGKGGR